ncbi:MAG: hypothetical protein WCJ29_05260 [bacterium]
MDTTPWMKLLKVKCMIYPEMKDEITAVKRRIAGKRAITAKELTDTIIGVIKKPRHK